MRNYVCDQKSFKTVDFYSSELEKVLNQTIFMDLNHFLYS